MNMKENASETVENQLERERAKTALGLVGHGKSRHSSMIIVEIHHLILQIKNSTKINPQRESSVPNATNAQ